MASDQPSPSAEISTPEASAPRKSVQPGARDVALVGGPTEDRKGLRVLRAREDRLEVGEVRPLEQGQPITGEVVRLRPRPGAPRICDVETQLSAEELARAQGGRSLSHAGPAQVASDKYRANWDAIYRSPSGTDSHGLN